jgi:hypothetical protein
MSDRISADLPPEVGNSCDFGQVQHHAGDAADVLNRWRKLLREVPPRGWDVVKSYSGDVMRLASDPRVLFLAAQQLRAGGPKAPGPNRLPLDTLTRAELWKMCAALGRAIRTGRYRPGPERVCWVDKASGVGRRPIVISDVQDRIVQKALALVLRPMLDVLFDPLSFGNRPWRGRAEAIAVAGQLALGGQAAWLTHDLKDAYRRVPVPRLLDVMSHYLPCPRLRALLKLVLPAQSRAVGGIKQGGPLSALALELYLTHVLHQPWRASGQSVRVLRFADDLLLTAADEETAKAADTALRELLTPAGMLLKSDFQGAYSDIRVGQAEWLGFRFQLQGEQFRITLGERAFDKLGRRFVLSHSKNRSVDRAAAVLRQWVAQLGPCFRRKDAEALCTRAILTAQEHGFEETVPVGELVERWRESGRRWKATRRRVLRNPGYLAPGPLTVPTPTSVVW